MKIQKHERIARLIRYNLISFFYLVLILAIIFFLVYNLEKLIELIPLFHNMLTFGV